MTRPPPIISRLASLGLAAILLLLTGFAIWAGLTTQQVTTRVSVAVHLSQTYDQARYAIAAEQSLARSYRLEPGPEPLALYRAAAAALVTALQTVRRDGDAHDRALVATVLAAHERYVNATYLLFDLTDAGNLARVRIIAHDIVDPAFGAMEHQVFAAANMHRARAAQSLAQLARTQGLIVAIMSVVFALAVLLSGLWVMWRRSQRQLDTATRAELTRLERAALTDNLTALGNHRAFQEAYHRAIARARERGETLALARIDIDEFKVINDQQGHLQGDRVLAALGAMLGRGDAGGPAFRLGGDEFRTRSRIS